jgi:hypothetical protein
MYMASLPQLSVLSPQSGISSLAHQEFDQVSSQIQYYFNLSNLPALQPTNLAL